MPGPKRMTWHDLSQTGIPQGTTAVINLAGQNVLDMKRRWTPGFKQNVWNSRVKTTKALADAIIKAHVKPHAFVTISGIGMYEPSNNTVYSEDSPGKEYDFLSKLCAEWEKAAVLPASAQCRQVTIRSGVVLGRDGGMIKQIYLPFYFGLGGPVGSGDQYMPWIHVNDMAKLILFAVESPGLKGILNGVAPQTITNREFANAFAAALWRPAFFPLPTSILNLVLNEERAKMITEGQRVVPKRTQSLGFKFVYPDIVAACQALASPPKEGDIHF